MVEVDRLTLLLMCLVAIVAANEHLPGWLSFLIGFFLGFRIIVSSVLIAFDLRREEEENHDAKTN